MNYEKQAEKRIKQLENILIEQKSDIKKIRANLEVKIKQLPNGDQNKAKYNDILNRIDSLGATKDKDGLFKLIEELRSIS